jgi:hypothetical protein
MSRAGPTSKAANAVAPVPAPAATGYEVGRPQGRCVVCGESIPPDEKFMAALRETPSGFERIDCMLACWDKLDRGSGAGGGTGIVAFWKATMPQAEARKKLFVDDEVLCSLFERLAEVTEPSKLNFRFVLGLILMRKRLLIYENTRREDDHEIWSMRFKGCEEALDLLNPQLTEEQVGDVSRQLGEILNEEL